MSSPNDDPPATGEPPTIKTITTVEGMRDALAQARALMLAVERFTVGHPPDVLHHRVHQARGSIDEAIEQAKGLRRGS